MLLKKLIAILLLALFVFNTIGYRLWIDFVQGIADNNLEARLDKGAYNDDDLMVVKVPLSLPYTSNWKEFERVDGEINFNGDVYKYVKRKVQNDTMILLCIRHDEKMQLQQKANDYFGKVNDLPSNENNGKKAEVFKQLFSDYDFYSNSSSSGAFTGNIAYNLFHKSACMQQYIPLHGQPPELIS